MKQILPTAWLLAGSLLTGAALAQPPAEPAAGAALQEVLALGQREGTAAAVAELERRRDAGEGFDPELQNFLGLLYLDTGRPQEALATLLPLAEAADAPAPVLFNAWRAAAALGQGAEYGPLLSRAARLEPNSPAGRELGLILGARGLQHDAYRLLRPWAESNPEDREVALAAAAIAIQLRRGAEAELLLERVERGPPPVELLWGMLYFLQGDPGATITTLKAMPSELPAGIDLDRRRTLARAHLSMGASARAIELIGDDFADDAQLALELARAQSQGGRVDDAIATLRTFAGQALDADSPYDDELGAALLSEHGQLLVSRARHDDALPYLRRANELDPWDKLTWRALGLAFAATGEREAAQAALERFEQLTSSEITPLDEQAALEDDLADPTGREIRRVFKLLRRGRADEALEIARAEAELAPGDFRPRIAEGQALLDLERPQEALAAAQAAIALQPQAGDAHYLSGVVRMALGQLEEAEGDFRAALQVAPEHTPAMSDLAVLLIDAGGTEEARALLERALELNPEDPVARRSLERIGG